MSSRIVQVVLIGVCVGSHSLVAQQPALPALSALTEECTISRDWIASSVPLNRSYAVWLRCGDIRFVVVHPDNLIGKVRIRDPKQALEFVRFFTSLSTYGLVHVGGCVEVVDSGDKDWFHVVQPSVYRRYFRQPEVEPQGGEKVRSFVITRTLLCPDQKIYRLREQLDEDGLLSQLSKTVALADARTVGLVHWPPPH